MIAKERLQSRRPDPQRPSVIKLGRWWWQARGFDPSGEYYVHTCDTLQEAYATAEGWARNGYPEVTA